MNKINKYKKIANSAANTKISFSHLGHAFRIPVLDFMVGGYETKLKGLRATSLCGHVIVSLADLRVGGLNPTCNTCIEVAKMLDIHN